jgi:hypothetical protein
MNYLEREIELENASNVASLGATVPGARQGEDVTRGSGRAWVIANA